MQDVVRPHTGRVFLSGFHFPRLLSSLSHEKMAENILHSGDAQDLHL